MKYFRPFASAVSAVAFLSVIAGLNAQDKKPDAAPEKPAAPAAPAAPAGDKAAAFRRFRTTDGKTFYAVVTAKTPTSATFKLQNGKVITQSLRSLSDPDKLFVQKWSKFKDDLLNNAEFATLKVQELLELRGYQSFEFDIQGNHIYVEGEMAGKPVRLLIDTGADSSLIHDAFAKEIGLEVGPYDQEIHGVAGSQKAAVTKLGTLALGDAKITGRRILATDLTLGTGHKDEDMIFGADFLRELDACISYREGRMFLKTDNIGKAAKPGDTPATAKLEVRRWTNTEGKSFTGSLVDKSETDATFELPNKQRTKITLDKLSEADRDIVTRWSKLRNDLAQSDDWRTLTVKELLELRSYQSFQYRLEGNHILVDGSVTGPSGETKARFLIDTGAHSCTMDFNFAKNKAKLEVGTLGETKVRGIGGEADAAFTKVKEIKLGDAVIKERTAVSAEIHKKNIGGEGNYDALFGAEFLSELDAVINYKEGRMFLRPDISDKSGEEK